MDDLPPIGTKVRIGQAGKYTGAFHGQEGEVIRHRDGFLPVGVLLPKMHQEVWFAEGELEEV